MVGVSPVCHMSRWIGKSARNNGKNLSTECPHRSRGLAAARGRRRLRGISTSAAVDSPHPGDGVSAENIHVVATASPRPVSAEFPRRSRRAAATHLHAATRLTNQTKKFRASERNTDQNMNSHGLLPEVDLASLPCSLMTCRASFL